MHVIRSLPVVVICLLAGLAAVQSALAQLRLPERGLDRSAVETRLGAPLRIEGPVGEPPITRWVYPDFIVVFEYDHVVHTVQRQPVVEQAPAGGAEPAPAPSAGPDEPAGTLPETAPTEAAGTAEPADRQSTGDTLTLPQ